MTCTLDEVHVKLESGKPGWQELGSALSVLPCELENMKTSSSVNPTKEVLDKAYCQDAAMTIRDLKRILMKIKRQDVCDVLADPSAPFSGKYNDSQYNI